MTARMAGAGRTIPGRRGARVECLGRETGLLDLERRLFSFALDAPAVCAIIICVQCRGRYLREKNGWHQWAVLVFCKCLIVNGLERWLSG